MNEEEVFDDDGAAGSKQRATAKLATHGRSASVQVEAGSALPPNSAALRRLMARGASMDAGAFPEAEAPMFTKRKEFIRLKNLQTGHDAVDTLHQSGIMVCPIACTSQRCVGSMMTPSGGEQQPKRPHGVVRPKEEVEEHARDFLNQYYTSLKSKDSPAHERRLATILLEIEDRGTYNITEKELAFGCKQAWRNAPRCIGRIQWSRLQLFDCRHVTTAKEMLDAIKRHIEYGTNGGNIRSAITVFPQRIEGQSDFRVWNGQFFKYAGFKQEDGSVIGDPSSLEFTEVCKGLGWKPEKEEPFVTLPLVLQARGQPPEWFDIADLNLEVDITHPTFEWFADMALKWYTVPAVTNMMLDCGGIEFPATPFNGWYMGTEVGRDLCDDNRYNVLPEVARRMELDTRTASSLWKDKALVEVNLAILYSYQKANVTISDHHSAAESFMKHLEKEYATRGGCPTDWVWVNPPMSASTTPVYHQEMLMYQLRPSYEYQEDPWKIEANRKLGDRKDRFKRFAWVVKTFNRMFKTSMSRRVKAVILYATETGRSATYAKKVGELFSNSFNYQVTCMDEYNPLELEHEQMVVIVTSTFGNGEPPENGVEFFRTLTEMANAEEDNSQWLTNIKFCVFGLGSRAYPQFCKFGKDMHDVLKDLGGESVHDVGEGDELCGQEESFHEWMKKCYLAACEAYHIAEGDKTIADKALSALPPAWEAKMFRLKEEKDCGGMVPSRPGA
ncbi:nitric oxide synthase 3-like [Sycon ciliatum]|uniref:nitric oxide synthase 3-like n=1 Tax=Sycon ciliatum TaxID=27933 RepID=UPI0031F67692